MILNVGDFDVLILVSGFGFVECDVVLSIVRESFKD